MKLLRSYLTYNFTPSAASVKHYVSCVEYFMKINHCPKCEKKAFSSLNQIFVEKPYITCQNCGAAVNHSIPHLITPNVVVLAILFLSINFLRDAKDYEIYIFLATLGALWISSIVVFTPLKVVSPQQYKAVYPKKSGGKKSVLWCQSPIVWLGIPIVIGILYGLFA
jgi:rRNA maturation protein Nop10